MKIKDVISQLDSEIENTPTGTNSERIALAVEISGMLKQVGKEKTKDKPEKEKSEVKKN